MGYTIEPMCEGKEVWTHCAAKDATLFLVCFEAHGAFIAEQTAVAAFHTLADARAASPGAELMEAH